MKRLALSLLLAAVPTGLLAHPHSYTDQQVSLILEPGGVTVRISIVPSYDEGPAIFATLDGDADGTLSDEEMRAFATAVLAEATLTLDGTDRDLTLVSLDRATRSEIEQGHGLIAIEARPVGGFDPGGLSDIRFAIRYDAFSPEWFVQPWIAPGALSGARAPVIDRSEDNSAVMITLPGS